MKKPRTSLNHRPALDGLRALAIIGVLVFHLAPGHLSGGWLGVDVFFVLSGFLITTLLIREHAKTGTIRLSKFWRARMRRLLPAVSVVLLAVLLLAWIWLWGSRRATVSGDVLASLFYVVNWHFIFGNEAYFSTVGAPSPVRHLWSLSIEEQFYVIFPVLLLALTAALRSRWRISLALGALALISAGWMSHLATSGADVSRYYFGTDTRVFELLIGAGAAVACIKFSWSDWPKFGRLLDGAAWLGLAIVVWCMFGLDEKNPWTFQGILVLFCLAVVPMVLAATSTSPTTFERVFRNPVLQFFGLISYPLYLWHWPLIVYLERYRGQLSSLWFSVTIATLSIVLAWLTYRFIELPIRLRRTMESPTPWTVGIRRAILVALPLVVVVSLFTMSETAKRLSSFQSPTKSGTGSTLVPPIYRPSKPASAMFIGNSIPASLYEAINPMTLSEFTLTESVNFGCDPFNGAKATDKGPSEITPECRNWQRVWPQAISVNKPDVALYFVPQTLTLDWYVNNKRLTFGTPAHDAFIKESLDDVRKKALAAGAKSFAITTLACHEVPTFDQTELINVNDVTRVRHLRELTLNWAKKNDAGIIDIYTALCDKGYTDTINGEVLYADGLHYTAESGSIMWDWMRPQLEELADNARDQYDSEKK
jgi:peptidoglycan/LPS O-acetylase OafA/YrhL